MNDRKLADEMAEHLELSLHIGAWTFERMNQWEDERDKLLEKYRAQREGEKVRYRAFKVGDVIQEGDQIRISVTKWQNVTAVIGMRVDASDTHFYRRPLTKGEEEDHIVDANKKPYPCPQCDGEGEMKKGECEACKGRGVIPIPEGSAVCEKCEGRGA